MKRFFSILVFILIGPTLAETSNVGSLTGTVRIFNKDGTPRKSHENAIVYIIGFKEDPADEKPQVIQNKKKFKPNVLAITKGQTVSFLNNDTVSHNIFSSSKSRKFDLGLASPPATHEVYFNKSGLVQTYCNIHPDMAANILVLPNKAFAKTKKDGSFSINNIPVGEHKVYVWHKLTKPKYRKVKIEANTKTTMNREVKLTKKLLSHKNKYGKRYKKGKKY